MYKKIFLVTGLVVLIGVLIFGAVNRTLAKNDYSKGADGSGGQSSESWEYSDSPNPEEGQGRGGGGGRGRQGGGNGQGEQGGLTNLPPASPDGLSAEETAALLYMREEEKLAQDVYLTLYEQWGLPSFQNIASSEQAHTDAVKTLLNRYGLDDPAAAQAGVFTNPELQALYTELVARGSQSLSEALKVGAAIEEIDILDLQERLAQTDNADIQQVFNNLLKGSSNHLRAFTSSLQAQTGETYQPQYLSVEAYQEILGSASGSNGRGGQRSAGGNGQGGRGRGGSGSQP
jgi:hypothetical protein